MCLGHRYPRVLEFALALLGSKSCLDDIRMGRLTGVLPLRGDVQEARRFIQSSLSYSQPLVRGCAPVVEDHDSLHQTASRNFEFCLGASSIRVGKPNGPDLCETERLIG